MTDNFTLKPHTDNYCVMGNPITQSKSPQIHHLFAEQTGQNLHYQAIQVDIGDFPQALDRFQEKGGKGLNITLPFKGDAWKAVDELTQRAVETEAVNTIWFSQQGRRFGDTTDGTGLIKDLQNREISLQGRRILILGAGGAVRSVLPDLLSAGPESLVIANRTVAKADALKNQFAVFQNLLTCSVEQLAGHHFELVINGTSASLSGELPVLPDDLLETGACCYDMTYADTDTVFIQWAKQHGAAVTLDGLGMLVEQAAESFYIWRGVRPETRAVIEKLRNGER